jgi:hypothetical protein
MKKITLEWIAGFFEGEGCCGFIKRVRKSASGKSYVKRHLYVSISQKERFVLDRIRRFLGSGCVVETVQNKNSFAAGNPICNWRTSHRGAREFLLSIKPLLQTPRKIKQVITALNGDRSFHSHSWNHKHHNLYRKNTENSGA